MRERIRKLIATLLAIVMVGQLPGFEIVISLAKNLYDSMNEVVSVDTSEEYIFVSGGANSLTIEENVSLTGTITDSGNGYANNTITNYGSTGQIIVSGGATTTVNNYGVIQGLSIEGSGTVGVTGGEINSMNVASTAGTVTVTGCTIGDLSTEKSVSFEGNNTASTASLAGADGTGSLHVTDSLTVNGEYAALDIATLSVDKETSITSDKAFSVMCEGQSYSISAGFDSSILNEYGMKLATAIDETTVTASSVNPTDITYWFGEITDIFVFNAVDGYYFDESYIDGITSSGKGTVNATLVDDTTLNLTYTFATDDAGEIVINLPAATFIPIDGAGNFSVADSSFGEDYTYTLSSSTHNVDVAVIEYKIDGADDSTYTATKPSIPGNYVARAILPGNETYKELTLEDKFSISKVNGSAVFYADDSYYGGALTLQLTSDTNDVTTAIFEYKVAGTGDDTYTATKPTLVGDYTARVTLPANNIYNQVVLTDDFRISFLPAPNAPYSVIGTTGDNGYYVSPVTITPANGYLVSDRLDGNYVSSLTIDTSMTEGGFYLQNIATGEKTAGIFTGAFYVDVELPFIDAIDENIYYAEYVEISVKDDNLSKITINGEEVKNIANGAAILKLNSDGGLKEYKIEVTDKAGNVKEITVVVAAAWAKSGIVPAGASINLLKDYQYKLGDGEWKIYGDSTSYNGNIAFYVKEEGNYTFVKQ